MLANDKIRTALIIVLILSHWIWTKAWMRNKERCLLVHKGNMWARYSICVITQASRHCVFNMALLWWRFHFDVFQVDHVFHDYSKQYDWLGLYCLRAHTKSLMLILYMFWLKVLLSLCSTGIWGYFYTLSFFSVDIIQSKNNPNREI